MDHTQYYIADSPKLTPDETELFNHTLKTLRTKLAKTPPPAYTEEEITKTAKQILKKYKIRITEESEQNILYHITAAVFGWGKLEPLRLDKNIEDISCVGWEYPVYIYHRILRDCETDIQFASAEELNRIIALFAQKAGRQLSHANPVIEGSLDDGSRIQITYGTAVSPRGSAFTIRKFKDNPYSVIDLIKNRTFTAEQMTYLWFAVEYGYSILIIGGTASGKTTTLNAVTQFIPPLAKIVTLEDTHELMLCHGNWQPSVVPPQGTANITLFDLVTAAMRQRPEYLIVGEVRGKETSAMFQAINTGHTSFSTFHAGDFKNAVNRLENPPLNIPKSMIESLDIVLSQNRFIRDGEQIRRGTEILEITGRDEAGYIVNTVFTYQESTDSAEFSGTAKIAEEICRKTGRTKAELQAEAKRRTAFLQRLCEENITDFTCVSEALESYRRGNEQSTED